MIASIINHHLIIKFTNNLIKPHTHSFKFDNLKEKEKLKCY